MNMFILKVVKKFLMSFVLIYTLDFLIININLFVPINFFTILISTVLGIPGTVSLVILSYIIS